MLVQHIPLLACAAVVVVPAQAPPVYTLPALSPEPTLALFAHHTLIFFAFLESLNAHAPISHFIPITTHQAHALPLQHASVCQRESSTAKTDEINLDLLVILLLSRCCGRVTLIPPGLEKRGWKQVVFLWLKVTFICYQGIRWLASGADGGSGALRTVGQCWAGRLTINS